MERAKVHDLRFMALVLLLVIAYSLATCAGKIFQSIGIDEYVARLQEAERRYQQSTDEHTHLRKVNPCDRRRTVRKKRIC